MIDRADHVHTCPDCGGLLHAIDTERLTTAEVDSDDESGHGTRVRQCLLCGYEERAVVPEPEPEPR